MQHEFAGKTTIQSIILQNVIYLCILLCLFTNFTVPYQLYLRSYNWWHKTWFILQYSLQKGKWLRMLQVRAMKQTFSISTLSCVWIKWFLLVIISTSTHHFAWYKYYVFISTNAELYQPVYMRTNPFSRIQWLVNVPKHEQVDFKLATSPLGGIILWKLYNDVPILRKQDCNSYNGPTTSFINQLWLWIHQIFLRITNLSHINCRYCNNKLHTLDWECYIKTDQSVLELYSCYSLFF